MRTIKCCREIDVAAYTLLDASQVEFSLATYFV